MKITNRSDISLEMAVWLLHDTYDYVQGDDYISATRLMKPIRHIVLPPRIPEDQQVPLDVEDLIPTSMGTALHDSIEKAWDKGRHRKAMQKLGIPEKVIDRVLVNPTPEDLAALRAKGIDPIPVYVEQRAIRQVEVDGQVFRVGGKFDMICEGRVTDTKSTSVWSWVYDDKDEDYQLQGSIYRWLNQDKVTEDFIRINFIFTDWSSQDAVLKADRGYPARRVMHKDIPLLPVAETESWVRAKLAQVLRHRATPESLLPECTPKELWLTEPKYKYYANGNTNGRSTKNFDTLAEAQAFASQKGKGTVVTVPGTPKRCGYCAAFPICTQKDKYTHD